MEKTFELQLFSYVYGHANHWNVVSSEAPDFLCILNGKTVLGVEITELLGTETDARLRKIGGYALDLCAGGDFLHKDDPKNIAVEVVKYMPQGKEDQAKDVTAIVQEIPRFDKRVSLLQETISFKESKFPSYLASCSNIDLVVEDASNLFWFEEYKDFFYQFSSFIDRAKLINSPFRVRPRSLRGITKFSHHQANGSELNESQSIMRQVFKIFGEAAATVEPGNRPLDNPAFG